MEFRFLTDKFFEDYKDCSEMERKKNRPYALMYVVELDGIYFAIPIRHHISHNFAVFTDELKTKGLDLSKTVLINDPMLYVNFETTAYISSEEYKKLNQKKYFVKEKLKTYIKTYKKALKNIDIPRNKSICEKSTLQYFHKELGIESEK